MLRLSEKLVRMLAGVAWAALVSGGFFALDSGEEIEQASLRARQAIILCPGGLASVLKRVNLDYPREILRMVPKQ